MNTTQHIAVYEFPIAVKLCKFHFQSFKTRSLRHLTAQVNCAYACAADACSRNRQSILTLKCSKPRKWPYVLGGFVAGVASTIGAAFFIDAHGYADSSSAKEVDTPLEPDIEDSTLSGKTDSDAEDTVGT